MEGFLPSSMEDDVNFTSNQFDLQSLLSELELLSPPPEVPVNQSFMLCNDHVGQNMVVDNNVINDSIQQTTVFPPSFPQTMTTMGGLNGTSSSWINQNEPNWPQTEPNQPGHDYMTPNATTSQHGGFIQPEPSFPPLRSPFLSNQGQDDQAAVIPNIDNMQQENIVPRHFGNSTRSQMDNLQVRGLQNQTARPNASNPGLGTSLQSQNRGLNTQQMEGFPPSSMDDLTEFDLELLFLSLPPEVPDIQSSILCNDQDGQNNVTMTGHMTQNAPTSQHGEFNQPGPSLPAPRYQPNPNLFDPQCVNPMLPGPSMPLWDQQLTNYQLPMSNRVPTLNFFNQWSQYFSNQGQVDQAAVIPNIDNVQQENFVPRSQMDNLQVRGLQNQTARPNASNPGLGTSLQSQN
uniref:Uncharacterized protein n=1 Tax=Populus trichocarpa TaxID=3694 RepID=A0A3N7FAA1_POPTR